MHLVAELVQGQAQLRRHQRRRVRGRAMHDVRLRIMVASTVNEWTDMKEGDIETVHGLSCHVRCFHLQASNSADNNGRCEWQ